jgi:hypothetical protein
MRADIRAGIPAGNSGATVSKHSASQADTEKLRRQVEMMAAVGNDPQDIARILGLPLRALRAEYGTQLDLGAKKANTAVAANLFRQATRDDPRAVKAAIFWLTSRAGWKPETPEETDTAKKSKTLGKKEQAQIAARTPDTTTPMGELMARRAAAQGTKLN